MKKFENTFINKNPRIFPYWLYLLFNFKVEYAVWEDEDVKYGGKLIYKNTINIPSAMWPRGKAIVWGLKITLVHKAFVLRVINYIPHSVYGDAKSEKARKILQGRRVG